MQYGKAFPLIGGGRKCRICKRSKTKQRRAMILPDQLGVDTRYIDNLLNSLDDSLEAIGTKLTPKVSNNLNID